jgi:hypothetical protein
MQEEEDYMSLTYYYKGMCLAALLTMAVFCFACNADASNPGSGSGKSAADSGTQGEQVLMGMDYSETIASLPYNAPSEDYTKLSHAVPFEIQVDRPLTPGEERLAGAIYIGESSHYLGVTVMMAGGKATLPGGGLPANGAAMYPRLHATDKLEEFLALSPLEQYEQVYAGINPVTGRFFESFDNPQWHPGGLYLYKLTADEIAASPHFSHIVALDGGVGHVFEVTVFAETEGDVLYTKIITINSKRTKKTGTHPARQVFSQYTRDVFGY